MSGDSGAENKQVDNQQLELLQLPPGSVWSAGPMGWYVILRVDGKERLALNITRANRVAGDPPQLEPICFLDRLDPVEIEDLRLVQVTGEEAEKLLGKALGLAMSKANELMEMVSIWNRASQQLIHFRCEFQRTGGRIDPKHG